MRIARPTEALPALSAPSPVAAEAPSPGRGAGEGSFANVLANLGRELDRGEAMSARAIRGGEGLSPSHLLALQAGIYRYSEAVELTTKLVDRATNAVRTTLQSQ